MLFSSITFLYYFLPWVVVLYFLVPRKQKNLVLLGASLFFYAWGEPKIIFCMLASILVGYMLSRLTEKYPQYKKLYLTLAVVFCLGILGYFKYANFFIHNFNRFVGTSIPLLKITLPIGISFYTFQILSYHIDVYRGKVSAQKNLIHLATYITMFPQLIAGPIVRYQDIEDQLELRSHNFQDISLGIRRFVLGLAKKVLLANVLGEVCAAFHSSNEKSVLFYWIYAVSFSLQIYFDFSGYSDMAIGLGKIFGFTFMENFDYPYISKSITEFWRRWHISLGSWFRDYVYIPLGGSKVGNIRMYLNLLIVWILTGLWHGAEWNFVIWGLYFAVLLVIEKKFMLKYLVNAKIMNHIYVMISIIISFVIFDATSMDQAFGYIREMFGRGTAPVISAEAVYYLKSYTVVLLTAIIGATPFPKKMAERIKYSSYMEPTVLLVLLVVVTSYLIDGSFNPFLYFRF